MIKATISYLLPVLLIAGCISTSNKLINKGVSRERGTQYIHFESIQDDPDVLHELFSLYASEALKVGGADILLELYKKKEPTGEPGRVYAEESPGIVVVSSADERVILKMDAFLLTENIRFKIPRIATPVIGICNPNGGNCWNCSPWYVISLEADSFLKNLGQVAHLGDFDRDSIDDLIWHEDIWEGGLGWFSHVGAPGATIYYHIEHGRLVPDTPGNTQHWRTEIRQFDVRIEAMSEEISIHTKDTEVEILKPVESPLLRLILCKFLRYGLLGESEKGWQELRANLRYRDDQHFFFSLLPAKDDMTVQMGRWPVEGIEKTVRESLENAHRFRRLP